MIPALLVSLALSPAIAPPPARMDLDDECGGYVASYGSRVLVVEYRVRDFRKTCARYGDLLSVVRRDRALSPDGPRRWC